MADVVGAFGVSHTAFMIHSFAKADPTQGQRVRDAYERVARRLEQLKPDAIVVVSSEHFRTFFFDNFPMFCLGTAPSFETWGEAQTVKCRVPGHPGLSQSMHEWAVGAGFDLAFSDSMVLDHGFVAPLQLLRPQMDIPIVPLFVNCTTQPLPTLQRCYALGNALRDGIECCASADRVVVLGTGGLSHWLGTPDMGRINETFDKECLDAFADGRVRDVYSIDNETVAREVGNGGDEIRNWLVMLGAARSQRAEILLYEPVAEWSTGIAVAEANCSARREDIKSGSVHQQPMSPKPSFELSDLAFRLVIDEVLREEFRSGDRTAIIDRADLSESEAAAIRGLDPRALLDLGLHPLILLQLAMAVDLDLASAFSDQPRRSS